MKKTKKRPVEEMLPKELNIRFRNLLPVEKADAFGVALVNVGGLEIGAYVYDESSRKKDCCLNMHEDTLKNPPLINAMLKHGLLLKLQTAFNAALTAEYNKDMDEGRTHREAFKKRATPFCITIHGTYKDDKFTLRDIYYGESGIGKGYWVADEMVKKVQEGLQL